MRKRMMAVCLMLILLMLPALAEESHSMNLARGDRGEDVYDLQTMLFECGWLNEAPDGIFGRNTEQAVLNYQAHANLSATGIADAETLSALSAEWRAQMGYDEAEVGDPPLACTRADDITSVYAVDCVPHASIHMAALTLLEDTDFEEAAKSLDLWKDEISSLYDRWMALSSASEKIDVLAAKSAFIAYTETETEALIALFPQDPWYACQIMEEELHQEAARLCGMLWTLDAGEEYAE